MGFRPVEREEVQTPATSRIELPIMLRASPMDRGGLHTWLATRKAESDRKREEEATSANNPWLAKSYEKPQSEKKKEELVAQSSTGSQVQNKPRRGNVKEQLKQDLLKAWAGGAETKVEAKMEEELPRVPATTASKVPEKDFAPVNLKHIHPMRRMHAEMQAAAERTWLARPEGKVQRIEPESSEKKIEEEKNENRAAALRKSLLSAWGSSEVTQKVADMTLSPATSATTTPAANVGKPSTTPIGCDRPLLAAWTSGQCAIIKGDEKEALKGSLQDTRRSLLSSWSSTSSSSSTPLEVVENVNMDDTASEASIVTLDTIADDSDDFDDFSDMKHELCQWISQ